MPRPRRRPLPHHPIPVLGWVLAEHCWCGCGKPTTDQGTFFLPGHADAALRRLAERVYGSPEQMLLAHGLGPYKMPRWRHTKTKPTTALAHRAIEEATRAGLVPMSADGILTPQGSGWLEAYAEDDPSIDPDSMTEEDEDAEPGLDGPAGVEMGDDDEGEEEHDDLAWLRPIVAAGPRLSWRFGEPDAPRRQQYYSVQQALMDEMDRREQAGEPELTEQEGDDFFTSRGVPLHDDDGEPYWDPADPRDHEYPQHPDYWVGTAEADCDEARYRATRGEPAEDWRPWAEQALAQYQAAVCVAELTMPDPFTGAIEWATYVNRPYLRALYGLGATQHMLGQVAAAKRTFTSLLWFNPTDNLGVRFFIADLDKPWDPAEEGPWTPDDEDPW